MTQPMEGWEIYTDPTGQNWPYPMETPALMASKTPALASSAAPAPQSFAPKPFDVDAAVDAQRMAAAQQAVATGKEAPGLIPGESPPVAAPDIMGAADRLAAAGGPPGAPDIMGAADRPPAMIAQTTTDTQTTTQGLDKGTVQRVNEATDQANAAAQASGQAQVDQLTAQADLERRQSQDAYGRGVNQYFENLGQMQAQDEIVRETGARLEETAKFQPDRTALFKGDNGVLFGISAAISAMAGGWLMGQGLTGGKNPYLDSVMRMIDDNAHDQVETNSLVYQELTKRLGSAEAAKRELKARMLEGFNSSVEAQSRFEKADLVQRGGAAIMADVQRQVASNRLEAAKLTGKSVSTTVQRHTQMVANPAATGGINVSDPKEYAKVGKVSSLQNFAVDAESLAKSGDLANAVGFFDSWTGPVARAANLSDKDRVAKVEALRGKWELMMRADWASEPNGQAVQERLSAIGWPKNDNEIPLFMQNVREALNAADPGGRYRIAARAMGNTPKAVETGRTPIVK